MVTEHTIFGSLIAGYRMESQWNTDYSLLNFEDMERKIYRVRTQYVFEGVFEVTVTDREEAKRKILEDCGMVMGRGIHSTLPDEQINWAFDTHPEERIIEKNESPNTMSRATSKIAWLLFFFFERAGNQRKEAKESR